MRQIIALFFFILHISTIYSEDLGLQITERPSGQKEISPVDPSSVNIHNLPSNVTLFSRTTAIYIANQQYQPGAQLTIGNDNVTVVSGFKHFCLYDYPTTAANFILVRLENNQLKLKEIRQVNPVMSLLSSFHTYFKLKPSFRDFNVAPTILRQLATNQLQEIPPTYEMSQETHRTDIPSPPYTP